MFFSVIFTLRVVSKVVIKFTDLYSSEALTVIYGPYASGKTSLALRITCNTVLVEGKVFFVSTENELFVDRILDNRISGKIDVAVIRDYKQQHYMITRKLESVIAHGKHKLVIVDSITGLMRTWENIEEAVKMLNMQLAYLVYIARKYKIPAIVTGQVRAVITEEQHAADDFEATAKSILEYWAAIMLRLEIIGKSYRKLIIEKHVLNDKLVNKDVKFKITEGTIVELIPNIDTNS